MPNPFRRLSSFFQDRVTSFTREINNTFSVVTGRRQTPLPEETSSPTPAASPQVAPAEKPGSFLGFVKSVATSPFAKELSQTAARKSYRLTENALFAGSILVGQIALGPVGALGLGIGVDFLQNRNQGRRQTLGKTAFTAVGIGAGAIAGAGIGATVGSVLGPVGAIIGSGVGSATGGLIGRTFGHRFHGSVTNIFSAAASPLTPNRFVTVTSNLTSILLLPITIPFDLFVKPLLVGCLILVATVLFAIFLIFALFIIPNPQTTGISSTKPDLSITDPLAPGCPSIWPTTSRLIIQGPHSPFSHTTINAIDIRTPIGSSVISITAGEVIAAGWDSGYGNKVTVTSELEDGTTFTVTYAHLSVINVTIGQQIVIGANIGLSGNTSSNPDFANPHLHLEYGAGVTFNQCPLPGYNPSDFEACYGVNPLDPRACPSS